MNLSLEFLQFSSNFSCLLKTVSPVIPVSLFSVFKCWIIAVGNQIAVTSLNYMIIYQKTVLVLIS